MVSVVITYLLLAVIEREFSEGLIELAVAMVLLAPLLAFPLSIIVYPFRSQISQHLGMSSFLMALAAASSWLGLEVWFVTDEMNKPDLFTWSDAMTPRMLAHYAGAVAVGVMFYRQERFGNMFLSSRPGR